LVEQLKKLEDIQKSLQ